MSDLENLPEDLQKAIADCKEFQRQRPDAPAEPPAFVIEAHGETMVCMPPGYEAAQRLQKRMGAVLNDKREMMGYLETYAAEVIFWMRGQSGVGPKSAIDHARKVAKSHYSKYGLLSTLAGEVQELLGAADAVPTSKKY